MATGVKIHKTGSVVSASDINPRKTRHDVLSAADNLAIDEQHRADYVMKVSRYARKCGCLERGCGVCFKRIM